MYARTLRLAMICVAACLLLACGCVEKRLHDFSPGIRLVNAIPGTARIHATVGNVASINGAGFDGSIALFTAHEGEYDVSLSALRLDGRAITIPTTRVKLAPHHQYTVILSQNDPTSQIGNAKIIDDLVGKSENVDQATIRVFNGSPDSNAVDISLNSIVSFPNVAFNSESGTMSVQPGAYQISALNPGNNYRLLAGPITRKLQPRRSYTVIITGSKADRTMAVQVIED